MILVKIAKRNDNLAHKIKCFVQLLKYFRSEYDKYSESWKTLPKLCRNYDSRKKTPRKFLEIK